MARPMRQRLRAHLRTHYSPARPLGDGTSTYATVLIILCWDGTTRAWANQGGIGLLINLAILLGIFVL